jgi:hypothetical protein
VHRTRADMWEVGTCRSFRGGWAGPETSLGRTGGRLDGRLHIRVHLWWGSRWVRRLLVVTGARCPLTKPVVTAVELQAATEPHCSRGVQPGGICAYVVQREPTPGGPGSGLRPGRKRFLCQLRSGSIYPHNVSQRYLEQRKNERSGWV